MSTPNSPLDFDADEIRREAEFMGARRVKRALIKRGYRYQMSLYGASYNMGRDEFTARRIEILSDEPYAKRAMAVVLAFFNGFIPPWRYSLWSLSADASDISFEGGYS